MKKLLILALLVTLCVVNLSFTYGKTYIATAYCLKGRTASGQKVRRGIVAADTRVHRLGSKIHITGAGQYSGIYTVADTGSKIKENRVDIWVENRYNAIRFGRRKVTVTVVADGTNFSKRSGR